MEKKEIKKISCLIIIIIFLVGVFICNNNELKNLNISETNEIKQESGVIINETDMLNLYSDSSDMRVILINKNSDNRFSIKVNHYSRVRISQSEYEIMKQNENITIDGITYEYMTSKEYSSLGIIKSTQDSSKKYYIECVDEKYEFQSVDNEGYDVPLTKFNKEFQYEVDQNYMIRIFDSNGTELSYTTLKELDSKWINVSLENIQANISRGPEGYGSEIIIIEK